MTRRFPPPRVGLPSDRERYDVVFEVIDEASPPLDISHAAAACRTAINEQEGDDRLSKSWSERMLNDMIRSGFLNETEEGIRVGRDVRRYLDEEDSFADCVFYALKRGWVLDGQYFPEGMEALEQILRVILYGEEVPIRSREIKETLKEDYNYGFSDQGIRGYLPLLEFIGAIEITDQGALPSNSAESDIVRIRDANVFHRMEKWLRGHGPLETPPSENAKQALMKYYMYRESGGWRKRRSWYQTFTKDYLTKSARDADNRKPDFDRKDRYTNKDNEEERLKSELKTRFGFESSELARLSVQDLRRITEARNPQEARITRVRVGSGVNRADFVDLVNDKSPYSFAEDFELYDWQRDAADTWFEGTVDTEPQSGIAEVVTGAGKTVMALEVIRRWLAKNEDGVVTIVVPTRVLMYQWLSELTSKLNVPVDEVGWAGDGTRHSFDDGVRVLVSIVNTAVKDDYLKNQLEEVGTPPHLLIADECHRYTGDVHSNVLEYPSNATLGLSATPTSEPNTERNRNPSESEQQLFELLGRLYYSLTYREAIERDLIAPFEIRYVGFDLSTEERQQYDSLTRKISDVVSDLKTRYSNQLYELSGSFQQKLNTIRKGEESGYSEIGQFFRLTDQRRSLIEDAVARQAITLDLLQSLGEDTKTIVFQEQIEQLEEMIAPREGRGITREGEVVSSGNDYRSAKYAKYPELETVDQRMEKLFADSDYWPVMYHSGHSRDIWNQFAMEWFRTDGHANVMYSVKALIEGVDVPDVDVGIVRVSSGSVRQRIQTLGRILRRGDNPDSQATLYVLYARDTVDENIFRTYDWETQLGNADLTHWYWETEESVLDGKLVKTDDPLPDVEEYEQPEYPDPETLSIGDPYKGPRQGYQISVDSEGQPFERSRDGRRFLANDEIKEAAEFVHQQKGGGSITINERGHMITMLPEGPVFVGVTAGPAEFEYAEEEQLTLTDEAPEFDDLF